ncbi:MAG: segregation and condensation protein A [Clostridia bacterium]
MTEENETIYTDDAYLYKLENFEGPLDLLLEIIKKNKLDIEDVRLADITGQYLQYIRDVENLDMEKAAEFILMASTLIEIKSKALMPRLDETPQDEEVDSEEMLKRRIKEYQLFKETAEKLRPFENVNHFYKKPDNKVGNPRFILKDMALDNLLDAFVKLMTKVDREIAQEEPKKIAKDRFTVAEKIASTKVLLLEKKNVDFEELFENGQTRSELINVFMALLELLKMQFAKIEQTGLFGKIKIFLNEENEVKDE